MFGQIRCYEQWLESNIREIQKSLPDTTFDIFILTDKLERGNYSKEGEDYIRNTFQKYNINIKLFAYWEDQVDFHADDIKMNTFNKTFLNNKFINGNEWMVNLWYRRYILWSMVKASCEYEKYDYFLYCRLFDSEIRLIKPLHELLCNSDSKQTLYTSIDTIFLGTPRIIDIIFLTIINH